MNNDLNESRNTSTLFPTIHTETYSIRHVAGPVTTDKRVWVAICDTVEKSMKHLNLPGHLFVTVVGAESLAAGEDMLGIGLYHGGIEHVSIPGGDCAPDHFKNDDEWLKDVQMSTAHEIAHYWQDINGKLSPTDECEDEAERIAGEICTGLPVE